jgi:hypothetical protein
MSDTIAISDGFSTRLGRGRFPFLENNYMLGMRSQWDRGSMDGRFW